MRRASYVDTNIDYAPNEEKVKNYKILLQKTEIKWQKNWFNNLTGDKQQQYKDQVAKMKEITLEILWKNETEKIQVEWRHNWLKNLTEDKKQIYKYIKKAHNLLKSSNFKALLAPKIENLNLLYIFFYIAIITNCPDGLLKTNNTMKGAYNYANTTNY